MRQGVAGVIGSQAVVEIVTRLGEHYPQLQFLPLASRDVTEADALLEARQTDIDVLLILDPRFRTLNRRLPPSFPVIPVSLWQPGIHRALFHARDLLYPGTVEITADAVVAPDIQLALEDLGLSVTVLSVGPAENDQALAEEHRSMYRKGRSALALTVSPFVHEAMAAQGAPAFLLDVSEEAAHHGLHQAVLEAATLQSRDSRLMIGLINVDGFADICRQMRSEFEIQKLKLRLHEHMLELVQPLGGFLVTDLVPDMSIIATRGMVEDLSDHFRKAIFVGALARDLSLSVSEGWGASQAAEGARNNARMALNFAIQHGGGCAYVMLEDSRCIGPLGSETPAMSVRLRHQSGELHQIIAASGVSIRIVDQLDYLSRKLGRIQFTSQEVAAELRMTERNARRILDRLCNVGLVTVEGEQVLHARGRPSRVFQLNTALLHN